MRAFLSHSHKDAQLVARVASELGRQFCVLDEQAFQSGVEFKRSIELGLQESDLFVLFFSKASSNSVYVSFEIEEAWYQKLWGGLARSLVFVIESGLTEKDLPDWLRRTRIRFENSAINIAREIRRTLDTLKQERQNSLFVGRNSDFENLEDILQPTDGSTPPRFAFVVGLPGVGRRTFIRHAASRFLSFHGQVEIPLGEGDEIRDISAKVAAKVEPSNSTEMLKAQTNIILNLSEEDALARLVINIQRLNRSGTLVLFVDDGGLLDNDGVVRTSVTLLLKHLPSVDNYIFLVTSRNPLLEDGVLQPFVKLETLNSHETIRLLSLYAERLKVNLTPADLDDLAANVAGYPPAAYFAIRQIKDYGIELARSERGRLRRYSTAVFLKHLSKSQLSSLDQSVLQLLATYSPLPLPVIGAVLSISNVVILNGCIVGLMDKMFVRLNDDGFYSLTAPLVDAVRRSYGDLPDNSHRLVAQNIREYTKQSNEHRPSLDLMQLLFRAARISKDSEAVSESIHLADDLIKVAQDFYYKEAFADARECAEVALQQRPRSWQARDILIKSLIQEEMWQEAERQLSIASAFGAARDIHFLRGFLHRKAQRFGEAIVSLHRAENAGRRGAALRRELGLCYYLNGNLEQAYEYIQEFLTMQPDQPYLINLLALISTRLGRLDQVELLLAELKEVGDDTYYYHRLSRVRLSKSDLVGALQAAKESSKSSEHPPFEVQANLVYCLLANGDVASAEKTLDALDNRYRRVKQDQRKCLRCKLLIAKGRFADALELHSTLADRKTRFALRIARDAMRGEIEHSALEDQVLRAYRQELSEIEASLSQTNSLSFVDDDVEDSGSNT